MRDWEGFVLENLSLPELKPKRERRIVRELAAQFEDFYREAVSGGMSEEAAERHAELQVESWEGLAREVRRVDRPNYQPRLLKWADAVSDPDRPRLLRRLTIWMRLDPIVVRRLLRTPRFLTAALLILGLGIGATTALFSVLHSVLLSPLPYQDPEQLVFVWETRDGGSRTTSVSLGNFEAWRASASGDQALAAARWRAFNITGGDRPYRVDGLEASSGLIALLGEKMLHGREFLPEDERTGAEAVCLVSHSFWQQRLGAREELAELQLILNGKGHRVVGVLPVGLEIMGAGPSPVLTPLTLDLDHPGYWSNHNVMVVGRLNGKHSLLQANDQMSQVASRLEKERPEWNQGIGVRLVPARMQLVQRARRTLWVLFGAVAFTLLIACVNVAGLLLARAAGAEVDVAVRVALGAESSAIVRLFFSEALLLSIGGGLLGLLIAVLGVEAIQHWGPGNLPRIGEISVSGPVLLFAMACAVGTGLLFGLAPAFRSTRVNLRAALSKGGRSSGLGSHHRILRIFVVAEVAIAVVLLNCSGLLFRTLANLNAVDPGFQSEGRVAMHISLPSSHYPDRERVTAFLSELHDRLGAIPGVRASGSSVGLPFQWQQWRKQLTVEGSPARTLAEVPLIDLSISTPGYAETLNIPLIRGRRLTENDVAGSPFTALVNEAFVRTHFSGVDPLGRRLRLSPPDALLSPEKSPDDYPWYTVVGVVGDVKRWDLTSDASPEAYIPQTQDMDGAREFFVVVRSNMPVESTSVEMRQAVWEVDPDLPVPWVRPIDAMISAQSAQPRFNAALVGAFALTALILASIGIYGLALNMVSARRPEIGLRVALGASPIQILYDFGRQGLVIVLGGIGIGLMCTLAATHLMANMLFGIEPVDIGTFLLVATTILVVASAAVLIPAWRAANLDAAAALASE